MLTIEIIFSIFITIVLNYIKVNPNLNCNYIKIRNVSRNNLIGNINKLEIELDEIDLNSLYFVIKDNNASEHKKDNIYKKLELCSYKEKIKLIKKIIILIDLIYNLEIDIKERILCCWNNNYNEIVIGFNMTNNDYNIFIDNIKMTEFINKEKNLSLELDIDIIKNLLVLQGLYITRYNYLINQINDNRVGIIDKTFDCLSYLELPFYISLIKQRLSNIHNDSVIEYSSTENLFQNEYVDNIFDGSIIEIISDINEVFNYIKSFRYTYINDYKVDIIYSLDNYLELNNIRNNSNIKAHDNDSNYKFTYNEVINIWINEKIELNYYKIKNNQNEIGQFDDIFNLKIQLNASNNYITINNLNSELEEYKNKNQLSLTRTETLEAIVKISELNSKNIVYKENQLINDEIISELHFKIIDINNGKKKLQGDFNQINEMNSYLINENSELLDRLLLIEKIENIENSLNNSNKAADRKNFLVDITTDVELINNKTNEKNENIENNSDKDFGAQLLMEFERDINNSCFDSIYSIERQYNEYKSSNENNTTILINKINELTDEKNNLLNINKELSDINIDLSNKNKGLVNEYWELNNKNNDLLNEKQKQIIKIDQICKNCENDNKISKEISFVMTDITSKISEQKDKKLIDDLQLDLEITSNQLMENSFQINSLSNSIDNMKLILQSTEIKSKESIINSNKKDKIIEELKNINNLRNPVNELNNLIKSNEQFKSEIELYKESIIKINISLEDSILSNDALYLKLDQTNKIKEENTINYNKSTLLLNEKINNLETLLYEKEITNNKEKYVLKNKIQELSSIIQCQEDDLKQYKNNLKNKYNIFNTNKLQISSPISDDILVEKSKIFDIFHSPIEDKNYRILSPCSNNTLKKPYNSIQFNSIHKAKVALNDTFKLV
jgi:hypothetical protein